MAIRIISTHWKEFHDVIQTNWEDAKEFLIAQMSEIRAAWCKTTEISVSKCFEPGYNCISKGVVFQFYKWLHHRNMRSQHGGFPSGNGTSLLNIAIL